MSYGTSVTLNLPFANTPGADLHVSFRTTCGREIRVGHLVLGGGRHPAQRVSLDIGASSDGRTGTWAGLTADEARQLATALLRHAAACDTSGRTPEEVPGGREARSGATRRGHAPAGDKIPRRV